MNQTVKNGATHNASAPARSWSDRFNELLDRNARHIFLWPAVVAILIFSVFPLVASAILAFSRIRLTGGGYKLRFAGWRNFEKQVFGSEQFHFLGTFGEISLLGWIFGLVVTGAVIWWITSYFRAGWTIIGSVGRLFPWSMTIGTGWLLAVTTFSGRPFGTLLTTGFYVFVGCVVQFLIGAGLAYLCSLTIRGRNFFRVLFFLPLMITPIGIGYTFRMMADTAKGPFAPVWQWAGLGEFSWAIDPWAARSFIIIADSWQWIPFVFVMMLAAFESVPKDLTEAAEVDGASSWQCFREITWPQVMPIAATVMLIRTIEAFKIVDLPNIMTSGGPGIATESMSLHAYFSWRSLDLGQASAVAYLLLVITVITCVSFFNLVVLKRVRT